MRNADQIAHLRAEGWQVKIAHYRLDVWGILRLYHRHVPFPVLPVGGETRVVLSKGDGADRVVCGAAARCSALDNYNRKIGVAIALGRAIKQLP